MHPATMWLSKQAGAAGPEESRTQAGSQGRQGVRKAGLAKLCQEPGSGMDRRSVDDLGSSIWRELVWRDGMENPDTGPNPSAMPK